MLKASLFYAPPPLSEKCGGKTVLFQFKMTIYMYMENKIGLSFNP